jgi:hypothetical protein
MMTVWLYVLPDICAEVNLCMNIFVKLPNPIGSRYVKITLNFPGDLSSACCDDSQLTGNRITLNTAVML